MKLQSSTFLKLTVSALLLGSASLASAAVIVWSPAADISGDTDVSTSGTFVQALSLGNGASPIVNGVTFLASTAGSGAGSFTLVSADTINAAVAFGPVGWGTPTTPWTGLSSDYQSLLASGAYGQGNAALVTINGLTPGQSYQVQFWLNDSRGINFNDDRTFTAGNSVTLDPNTKLGADQPSTFSGVGQFATGTFIADISGTQDVTISNFQLNGYQLRDISAVPEPSALALAGLGIVLLARRRSARTAHL